MVAKAAAWAAATVSWSVAISALFALACVNHARYGPCAATYDSALGPSHAPAWAVASTALSSCAAEAYSVLNADQAPAAASRGPGPGPVLSNAECTSGGEAIQIGAVIGTLLGRSISPDRHELNEYDCRYQLGDESFAASTRSTGAPS